MMVANLQGKKRTTFVFRKFCFQLLVLQCSYPMNSQVSICLFVVICYNYVYSRLAMCIISLKLVQNFTVDSL